jgi:hypothetical protein
VASKSAFVISPIGPKDSEVRKHADDVFETIVQPALEECGLIAVRADHMEQPGKITDQVLKAIQGYDLCVAVLTGHNPNVFYEVAVAQAIGRPIVLMIRDGEAVPFDVAEYRLIKYDMEPRSIFCRTFITRLKLQVELALSSPAPQLIPDLTRLPDTEHGPYWINRTSREFGEAPRFIDVVLDTHVRCDLMGISLRSWGKTDSSNALLALAQRDCTVSILIMHPDHKAAADIINDKLPSQDGSFVRKSMTKMYEHFIGLSHRQKNISVRQVVRGIPRFQLIITDQVALCLQYLYSRASDESPLLRYSTGTPVYQVCSDEFEELWSLNDQT